MTSNKSNDVSAPDTVLIPPPPPPPPTPPPLRPSSPIFYPYDYGCQRGGKRIESSKDRKTDHLDATRPSLPSSSFTITADDYVEIVRRILLDPTAGRVQLMPSMDTTTNINTIRLQQQQLQQQQQQVKQQQPPKAIIVLDKRLRDRLCHWMRVGKTLSGTPKRLLERKMVEAAATSDDADNDNDDKTDESFDTDNDNHHDDDDENHDHDNHDDERYTLNHIVVNETGREVLWGRSARRYLQEKLLLVDHGGTPITTASSSTATSYNINY